MSSDTKEDTRDDDMDVEENTDLDAVPIIDDNDVNSKCGFSSFRPDCLQMFANIGTFIGVFSISGLLTSTLSIYVNSQVPMLEKEFGFSSADSGLIMSCNDLGYLTCVIFAGYIAKKVHIPIGLGISMILFGICGVLCALPYFIQDKSKYDLDQTSSGIDVLTNMSTSSMSSVSRKVPLCMNTTGNEQDSCDVTSDSVEARENVANLQIKRIAFYLICFGMVFQGIGKSPRYPFVTLYVDDTVEKRKTGYYMGIVISTAIFGPALAFILGGLFSKIYVTLQGLCDQGCSSNLYIYAAFTFIGKFFTALKIMPTFISQIRCVAETDRAAATAFAGFTTSALAWMPGPVIMGVLIDKTCTLWKYSCGERQSCSLYDSRDFRTYLHGFSIVGYSLACLILVLLYLHFRISGKTEWREEDKIQNTEKQGVETVKIKK
ncbi:hypothetical protein ACF0H5_023090 [Mactra antiquata]